MNDIPDIDRKTPDYVAMAQSLLKVAADLRRSGEAFGNAMQLEQALRLEQIAHSMVESAEAGRLP